MNDINFSIVFSNPQNSDDTYSLDYNLTNTPISRKWFRELTKQVELCTPFKKDEMFYNFTINGWTEDRFEQEINKCIEICNAEHPGLIDFKVSGPVTQEQHNILHTYFEKYRGPILDPHPFFKYGSLEYRDAMESLNLLIHRYESFNSSKNQIKKPRRIVVNYESKSKYNLLGSDYVDCMYHKDFGDIALLYCEVGKPLYDVFKDGDEHVGDDNIRPLRFFSSDFVVYFPTKESGPKNELWISEFRQWYHRNENWLKSIGLDQKDPAVLAGPITVAKLVYNGNKDAVVDNIEVRQNIKEINVYW